MLSITQQHLEKFDNEHDFERLASDILNKLGYKDVTPIAPSGGADGGKDITYTTYDGNRGCAFVSLRKDVAKKFNEDIKKCQPGEFVEYHYFTNQVITPKQRCDFTQKCNGIDAEFKSYDLNGIRSLLDVWQDLRELYLHITLDDTPSYQVEVSNVEMFSAENIIRYAKEHISKRKARQGETSSPGYSFGDILASTIKSSAISVSSGYESEETILRRLEEYQYDVILLIDNISRLVSFNLDISANKPDDNVEVEIELMADNCKFSDDYELLVPPEAPRRISSPLDRIPSGILPTRSAFSDKTEFSCEVDEPGRKIVSTLNHINPHHKKVVFDERVLIVFDSEVVDVPLRISVYSKNLSKPFKKDLTVLMAEAQIVKLDVKLQDGVGYY